jgi:molecular chaperone GrpE
MPSSHASEGTGQRTEAHEGHEHPEEHGQPDTAALTDELARVEDRYRRALADLDNYRKRSAREVERRGVELREALVRDWLEVVDSVERALRIEPQSPLYEGMRAVLDQIEAVLARQGVERIGTVGERFDPERHEAISVRETDEADDRTVLEVARSGFAVGDRVLRPAQVVVSRRRQAEPAET